MSERASEEGARAGLHWKKMRRWAEVVEGGQRGGEEREDGGRETGEEEWPRE